MLMNDNKMNKNQILGLVQDTIARWDELLSGLSEEQVTARKLPGGWSIKDVMAHLMTWQKRTNIRMDAALRQREPQFPGWPEKLDPEAEEDLEQVNAWIYAANRDRAWMSVYRDWREGFLRLIDLTRAVPESDLLSPGRYAWLDGERLALIPTASVEHHQEHYDNLTAWLRENQKKI